MFKNTILSLFVLSALGMSVSHAENFNVLKQISDKPTQLKSGDYKGNYYVPSTLDTITWGYLPNRDAKLIMSVASGSVVTFDTVSHEGLLEDQGRDAAKYFKSKGVKENFILEEAKKITQSNLNHDFYKDGTHIVTGPIEIKGAQPGDILKVEVIKVEPRVPYGVISNRHGKGALVGEFLKKLKQDNASMSLQMVF
jgi:acetamidase/formamidase